MAQELFGELSRPLNLRVFLGFDDGGGGKRRVRSQDVGAGPATGQPPSEAFGLDARSHAWAQGSEKPKAEPENVDGHQPPLLLPKPVNENPSESHKLKRLLC